MKLYKYLRIKTAEDTGEKALDQYQAVDAPKVPSTLEKALMGAAAGGALGTAPWLASELADASTYMEYGRRPEWTPTMHAVATLGSSSILGAAGHRMASRLGFGKKGRTIGTLLGAAIPQITNLGKMYGTTTSAAINVLAPIIAGSYLGATWPSKTVKG